MNSIEMLPADEYNAALVNHVHPPDWSNPIPSGKYNLIAIGGGSAGIIAALGAAGLGGTSALIERGLLGGDCLNFGCVPSKSLIRSARAAHAFQTAPSYGVNPVCDPRVEFERVMERMRHARADISRHDAAQRFSDMGVDVYLGAAKFTAPDAVQVAGQTLKFARCVIATGGRPQVPPIPGLEESGYLTNETIFSLTKLPARLAVLGLGPIGAEMAQTFRRFGSEVHAIEKESRPLSREEPAASDVIRQQLLREGVHLYFHHLVTRVEKNGDSIRVTIDAAGDTQVIEVDAILVALGRRPNVEGLSLDKAGVEFNKKGVIVNDRLQTTNPRIFAAGDIAGSYQFTHAADAMARACLRNSLFYGNERLSNMIMPRTTYTDPEVAHVGLTPAQAQEQGLQIDSYREEMRNVDRAVVDGETAGYAVIHTRRGSGTVVGATIVAPHAGEMIGEVALLMTSGRKLDTLSSVIHCYPTQVEVLKRIADQYRRTKLSPLVKALFQKWLAWHRR
ncbi:mercuric reductase [Blastopirellula sp. JC732]|uniref:Mercuric reductase n=1 Tax=Blastopirellula sediminis TaxID=2894196 RepID=A0A9X1MM67_9BACT|nr:mercuric reductase [Blastopirellula sediminis]MCC9607013.1 mercuric reductase [Blastopirellula sediminis]MCC9629693.1 mercuric reductase [Blastopirellula sediminis]